MKLMFNGASSFNSDSSNWNVASVIDMNQMFLGASSFNSNLSGWNVVGTTSLAGMFAHATSFNSNLCEWNEHLGSSVAFDAFSETDMFNNFETSSTRSRLRSNTDEDSELLSKELKAAIQSKTRKPPLLPPSGRPRQK